MFDRYSDIIETIGVTIKGKKVYFVKYPIPLIGRDLQNMSNTSIQSFT